MTPRPDKNMNLLGELSAAKRQEKARIKKAMKAGDVSIGELLAHPPEVMLEVPLVDLIRWKGGFGVGKLNRLGKHALVKGVNLMVPLGRASERSRYWLASELGDGPAFYEVLHFSDEELEAAA